MSGAEAQAWQHAACRAGPTRGTSSTPPSGCWRQRCWFRRDLQLQLHVACVNQAACAIGQRRRRRQFRRCLCSHVHLQRKGLSATQLQAGIAAWQTAQAFAVAAATELYCYTTPADGSPCDTAVEFFKSALLQGDAGHQRTLWIVLGTCFLALAVNLCSFGLIGKTSAITFQVVGHAKTCLVLAGGYLLFPSKLADTQQLYNNIAGVSFAMIGVILYGHLKHASSQDAPDCLDMVCPGCCLYYIEPKYSEAEREETEGLKGGANA